MLCPHHRVGSDWNEALHDREGSHTIKAPTAQKERMESSGAIRISLLFQISYQLPSGNILVLKESHEEKQPSLEKNQCSLM
ncbi:mCG1027198, isoform CRA_a [Mus musculus]|nr:mCG1027198, isoform CRA_a [Mus musculus]